MESCETCRKYWVDQGEVALQLGVDHQPLPRGVGHVPAWSPDLCAVCTKAEYGLEDWTTESEATWQHYCAMREMGATDSERGDERVRQNAARLGETTREIDEIIHHRQTGEMLAALFGNG